MNVLITNVGRRGYLVDFLRNTPDFNGKIYVSDCCKSASGLFSDNDGAFYLPKPLNDENLYIQELVKLCHKLDVSIVFPVIDPEIDILSRYVDELKRENINVVVSDSRVLGIAYNKLMMNKFLEDNGFNVPKTYTDLESFNKAFKSSEISFPVILKPIYGSGSAETYKIKSIEQLKGLFHEGLMIQQLIVGHEYGCDVLNNLEKEPVRCVVKRKLSMRAGETDKAITVKDKRIQNEAIRLGRCLGHIGNLDSDVLDDGDKLYFIDLNPRFGGGYPITHSSGVNYLDLIIKMYQGEKISPDFENYNEDVLVMKTVSIKTAKIEKGSIEEYE